MKISHPAVFIFGAGATAGAFEDDPIKQPPLDNNFFEVANRIIGHGTNELAQKVLRAVWELYKKTDGIGLERYYRDIETRAIISKFAKSANRPKEWKMDQKELVELIRRVYVHLLCDTTSGTNQPVKSGLHSQILNGMKAGDTIITFNYDLLIEESFNDAKLWNPIDGYGVEVTGITFDWARRWMRDRDYSINQRKESKIELLKLHGSINWQLYENKSIKLKQRPYYVGIRRHKPAYENISILAPGWNKPIDKNPYKKLWEKARHELEKCKSLFIYGYSLPDTDLLAQALFYEAIRQRTIQGKHLKELHIADPSVQTQHKFIEAFTPAIGPIGKIFKYKSIKEYVETNKL
jgi:hypothetical protein